jgi:TusA-related sulfurtransferase
MAQEIDARGLSCPQPVILARNAIGAGSFPIEILVDTVTSRENVKRTAHKARLEVAVETKGENFKLTISKP